jgi:heat shock protein HslJ
MKKVYLLIFVLLTFFSCDSTQSIANNGTIDGLWELYFIEVTKITFDDLYPGKKPFIQINNNESKISGNSSCNQYFGKLLLEGTTINFKNAEIAMTKMACQGDGEPTFMTALQQVDSFMLNNDGKTLDFKSGGKIIMSFTRKKK